MNAGAQVVIPARGGSTRIPGNPPITISPLSD